MILYCWTPDCHWRGYEEEADWKHVKIVRDNSVVAEFIDKSAFCPKCGGSLYDEAEEELAGKFEYDAGLTRKQAEQKVIVTIKKVNDAN